MNSATLPQVIQAKALELGFDRCGIIRVGDVADYEDRLEERIRTYPDTKPIYDTFRRLAAPQKTVEWARSIIVCITHYGKYRVPQELEGRIGKFHLFDHRLQSYTREYSNILAFETVLREMGLTVAKDEVYGVTSARWAAHKARLGIIRKNNFFYTDKGSWVRIETWLIDRELELLGDEIPPACPEGCQKCIDSCPSRAMTGPYAMNMARCVTWHTYSMHRLPPESMLPAMGSRLYGCDACQDACPMNHGTWKGTEEFPNLSAIVPDLSLEAILEADEQKIADTLGKKFWYIKPDRLWVWKLNALRAMANDFRPTYEPYLRKACRDQNEEIRRMAEWACRRIPA